MLKIVFTGGGTAGHVTKNVAVIDILKKNTPSAVIHYIGSGSEFETRPMEKRNIAYHKIRTGKLRRYFSFKNITDLFTFLLGVKDSKKILKELKPNVVFSSGGYVALPVAIAARMLKIPIITHESDSVPGLANRIIAKIADTVCITFETTKKHIPEHKTIRTGNPVRDEILGGSKEAGLKKLQFNEFMFTILVMGGSQGAKTLNDLLMKVVPDIIENTQIIHITGHGKETGFRHKNYREFAFLEANDLSDMYAASDIIISRAGTNAISEILAMRKPSILIPLATAASNHQEHNANETVVLGYALCLKETGLKPEKLKETILNLKTDKKKMNAMIQNMQRTDTKASAQEIVELIKKYESR